MWAEHRTGRATFVNHPRHLLVLADRSVSDPSAVPGLARWLASQESERVTVLAPLRVSGLDWLTGDTASNEADAQRRAVELRDALQGRVEVRAAVADDDPVAAVVAALADHGADAVVVLRPEDGDLSWRERDLGARLRREVDVPVSEVVIDASGAVTGAGRLPVDPDAPGGSVDDRESPEAVEPNEPA